MQTKEKLKKDKELLFSNTYGRQGLKMEYMVLLHSCVHPSVYFNINLTIFTYLVLKTRTLSDEDISVLTLVLLILLHLHPDCDLE